MNNITLEEKRKLSKLLGENLVEQDDSVAMQKIAELFKNCATADMLYGALKELPQEEQDKFLSLVNSKDNEEESETADETKSNSPEENVEKINETESVEETEDTQLNDNVESTESSKAEEVISDNDSVETEKEGAPVDTDTAAENPGEQEKEESQNEEESYTKDNDELFDAKLEAALLRCNVREDKLESAKKLFKVDHTIEEIEKVKEFVKSYPEWINQKSKQQPQSFGMEVGENDTSETAEEKRLRELGW